MNRRCTPGLPFWIARLMAPELCIWGAHGGISHAPSSLTHTCLTSSMARDGVTSDSPTDNSKFHHPGFSFILSQAVNAAPSFANITALMQFLMLFQMPNPKLMYLCVQESVLRPVPLLRSRGHIPSTSSMGSRVNALTGKTLPLRKLHQRQEMAASLHKEAKIHLGHPW